MRARVAVPPYPVWQWEGTADSAVHLLCCLLHPIGEGDCILLWHQNPVPPATSLHHLCCHHPQLHHWPTPTRVGLQQGTTSHTSQPDLQELRAGKDQLLFLRWGWATSGRYAAKFHLHVKGSLESIVKNYILHLYTHTHTKAPKLNLK